MDKNTIAKVQSYGFDVYMRKESDTYMLFTDGTRIGYLQQERGIGAISLSTVHIPNQTTGTGFQIQRQEGDFDKPALEACFSHAPRWASSNDYASVKKWRDMGHYRAYSSFDGDYALVPPVEAPATETRYFKADVRPENAQGRFAPKVFELTMTVTGSHHKLTDEAIRLIRAQGFETNRIISHSARRDCL